MTSDEVRASFEAAGQGHVFAHWEDLDAAGREQLTRQAAAVDLDLVARLRALAIAPADSHGAGELTPPEVFPLRRDPAGDQEADEARARGVDCLKEGLVGYVLVAGGQGSRLGFEGPKGKYPLGPVGDTTLFDWHARRLLAARERHGARPVWYVMTSATNDLETRAYFEERGFFGLEPDDVFFFQQDMLPALDTQGRILLSAADSLFLAPNGHGGCLAALRTSGALSDMESRGIEVLSYFQVDNPLVRPADPLFLGLHVLEGASMSSKVVAKRDAGEKVGVLGRSDGKLTCIEYSDLSDELRHATGEDGGLLFGAGNIAVHALERRFVEELTEGGLNLPWHLARKRMGVFDPTLPRGDADDRMREVEGIKFETFVFDALGHSERSVTLEVDRSVEFSPVKNAEGQDSPETCRRDLTKLFAAWMEAAGRDVPAADAAGVHPVEVDPRFAEDAEEFASRLPAEPSEGRGGQRWG